MRKILHSAGLAVSGSPIPHLTVSRWKGHTQPPQHGLQKKELPFTLITKCPLGVFSQVWGQARVLVHEIEVGTPLLRDEGHSCLCCDLLPQVCYLRWVLWLAATLQSPGTQVLCEGDKAHPAGTAEHRVTKNPTGFGLLSLSLLVSCKTTWVHLESTAGLQTMPLDKQQQHHQICSPKTLSLCWVSAQGRHSKDINDFGQHGALTVIAFTVIVETLKLLQQMYFVVHPGTVVLPFIIYLYLAPFHIFWAF